jgi:type VI protein secretion system component VasA
MSEYLTASARFHFTEIKGSTTRAQQYPESGLVLLGLDNEILNQEIETHLEYVFQLIGASIAALFLIANNALNAALQVR